MRLRRDGRSHVELIERIAQRTSAERDGDEALLAAVTEICRWTGFPLGHAYLVERDPELPLPPSGLWHGTAPNYRPLVELTAKTPLAPGVGLPGRVMSTGRPEFIPELSDDANLPRRTIACEVGLRSAFAFPVQTGERCLAVLEFFSPVRADPGRRLLDVFVHIGRQLGRLLAAMGMEEALRESERRFRSFADSANDAMITADETGAVVSWNLAAERMFGYRRAEVTGRPLSILMPERFRERHDAGLRRVVDGGTAASRLIGSTVEVVGARKDGTEFPIELSLSTWESAEGRFFGGIIRDIADRKHAEEHARALDNAPDPIVKVDAERVIRLANARAEELFGVGLVGRPVAELFAPVWRVRTIRHFAADSREPLEPIALRADGNEFEAELTLSAEDGGLTCVIRDVSERKRYERRLRHLADHDGLTGLVNRRRFEECIDGNGAVVLLGLDRFKYVNDAHGHTAGDDVLRAVAGALRVAARPGDVVARLGGDEFAVLLDGASLEDAARIADELVRAVAECRSSQGFAVGASAGVVRLGDAERPLLAADLAMHAAKEAGGNRVHVTHGGDSRVAGMQARVARADQVRRALAEDRFTLYWQPIVDLAGGEATRYELLLRMIGSDGAIVLPGAFIEVAERFGLIGELDRWVIRRAIRLLAEREDVQLEVNVSGCSLTDAELPSFVERELSGTGVDPGRLIFEITETSAIADMEQAREFAERLTRLGCRFALDDFGAGFSSFHYLKYLPLDYLKIDGDFVRKLASSPTDRLVVKAMVDIARGMGMKTIAEFVEDAETVELLRELGVDYSQGYHHGRPVPVGLSEAAEQFPQQRGQVSLLDG
jgi:PAS domain S-box-containing protein/diguanylate cyclase (GGDEF)-like protein